MNYVVTPHAAFEMTRRGIDEDRPGGILDYDDQGNLVSLEVLDASKRVTEARKMEFKTTV